MDDVSFHHGNRAFYTQTEKVGLGLIIFADSQRGIVGADLASILAKRNAKPEVRHAARQAAITKAKEAKKEKEGKKAKVSYRRSLYCCIQVLTFST